MLNQNLIVFVDQVQAEKPHTFDLAIHVNGKWRTPVSGAPPVFPSKDGYQHLRDVAARKTVDGISLAVDAAIVRLAGPDPTEVITATGVGKSTEDRVPMAIFRRVAQKTTYVWTISNDPVDLAFQEDSGGIVSVAVNTWRVTVDPAKRSVDVR